MKITLSVLIAVFSISVFAQSNWPQYLGPNRNSIVEDVEIANTWPEEGPRKVWEMPLGLGYGGASVYDGEVFLLDRKDSTQDVLRCIDLNSGEEKWNFAYSADGALPFPGSRAVPTVDDKYVWSVGPHGHFYCVDKKTHQAVWMQNIKEDFEIHPAPWGIAQSPIIYNDLVLVSAMGEKAGVVAYDKLTGELRWKSRQLSGRTFYSSLTLANYGGVDQVIAISPYVKGDSTKLQEIAAFAVADGEELWSFKGFRTFGNITPATVIDENRLFITDCSYNDKYKPASIMLNIEKTAEGFVVDSLFLTQEAGCKMHPAVLYNDHLYLNNNGIKGKMTCMTLNGEVLWGTDKEIQSFEMGGYIRVGDFILNQNGKNGDIFLIEPSPQGYKQLATASFFTSDKSQAWAPLAFADGKLLIRDNDKIVCLNLMNP